MTLEDAAEQLFRDGYTDRILSRERIRQIESVALRKLEEGMKRIGYSATDLLD